MADQAQRRTLDEIEQQVTSDRVRTTREIDDKIAEDRQCYLAAYFAGSDGEAQFWVYEIARLENLRNIIQRQRQEYL